MHVGIKGCAASSYSGMSENIEEMMLCIYRVASELDQGCQV